MKFPSLVRTSDALTNQALDYIEQLAETINVSDNFESLILVKDARLGSRINIDVDFDFVNVDIEIISMVPQTPNRDLFFLNPYAEWVRDGQRLSVIPRITVMRYLGDDAPPVRDEQVVTLVLQIVKVR